MKRSIFVLVEFYFPAHGFLPHGYLIFLFLLDQVLDHGQEGLIGLEPVPRQTVLGALGTQERGSQDELNHKAPKHLRRTGLGCLVNVPLYLAMCVQPHTAPLPLYEPPSLAPTRPWLPGRPASLMLTATLQETH